MITGRLMRLAQGCLWAAMLAGQTHTEYPGSDLRVRYENHEWFKLREAVQNGGAPVFYRGAVACAFNNRQRAMEELNQVIRSAPTSDEAYSAHQMLNSIYWRAGQFRRALAQLDAMAEMKPEAADVKEFRKLFAALAQFPEQAVTATGYSRLRYEKAGGNIYIPVAINGQATSYMLDTGANISIISLAEANRRKLRVAKGTGQLAGGSTVYSLEVGDVALAEEFAVGNFHFENVSFLVLPDESFKDIRSEQRAVLGLPVLLSFGKLRWTTNGVIDIGLPATGNKTAVPNLYFDQAMLVVQVEFGRSKLDFALDTGAVETDLYPRFAKDFSKLVTESGREGTRHRVAVGGEFNLDSVVLPDLKLRVGGLETTLHSAQVLKTNIGSQWHYGNLGLDVLSQANTVTLDFRAMTLSLE